MEENRNKTPNAGTASDGRERAVLVAVVRDDQDPRQAAEFLDELEFLAETADIESVKRFTQRLPQPSSRIYVGPGKLEEIAGYCKEQEIDVVIFDDELSPSQTRNIEKAMPCRILDRTRLILDIFMSRAQTAYAKTQVQLANYEYMLPRLSGMWTHLERQRGGTGTRGGAGEREIETDRRIIRNRIAKLKEDLRKIDRQMAVQRSNRGSMVRVALVGYTNVGKSTLMNLLSGQEKSIVTQIPGTTRDIVEDTIRLGDIVLNLADTAGLRDTDDPVEKVGVELAKKRLDTSYLVLAVFDSSEELSAEDMELIEKIKDRPVVAVINKSDLSRKIDVEKIRQKIPHIAELSASAGEGVAELEAQVRALLHLSDLDSSASVIANERQRACVEQASRTMNQALEALQAGQTLDAINVCIDSAIDSLLELTGERASDAVIDQVFARFCVGK